MRMRMLVLLLAVAGCAAIDRPEMSSFEPFADGRFVFRARADSLAYRLDSPDGEAERMRWLSAYLGENSLCAAGFSIEERKVVAISTGLATVHDLYYRGRCKPAGQASQ